MPIIEEFAAAFSELTNGVGVVFNDAFHVAVFLEHVRGTHLITSSVLTDHVQLLLTHPRLGLGCVEKVLQQLHNVITAELMKIKPENHRPHNYAVTYLY